MSRKIITTYNNDPSAGNNPATDYKVAATDSAGTSVALDMDQLAAVVSGKIGVTPPPVDPPPDPDDEDLNQLVITILPNTLSANIDPITGVDYTHFVIQADDATTPTYPTDFSQGPVPALHSLAADPDNPVTGDWVSEDVYLWAYDLPTTTMKPILTPSGEAFVTVSPNDTVGPVWVSGALTVSAGTDTATQVDWVISPEPIDAGTGASGVYEIWEETLGRVRAGAGATGTINNLTPGVTYNFYAKTEDLGMDLDGLPGGGTTPPNVSDSSLITGSSDPVYEQITTTDLDQGLIGFSTTAYEVDEDSGPAQPILVRVDANGDTWTGTKDEAITCDVSTINWTASSTGVFEFHTTDDVTDGTEVIDLNTTHGLVAGDPVLYSKKGGSANIGITDKATVYVSVPSTTTVKVHLSQADAGADPAVNPIDLTGAGAETHHLFSGAFEGVSSVTQTLAAGTTTENVATHAGEDGIDIVDLSSSANNMFEIYIDQGSISANSGPGPNQAALIKINSSSAGTAGAYQEESGIICFSAEHYTSITVGDDSGTTPSEVTWEDYNLSGRLSQDAGIRTNNNSQIGTNADPGAIGVTDPNDLAPKAQYSFENTSNVDFDVWVRCKKPTVSYENEFHCGIDDATNVTTLHDFNSNTAGTLSYKWIHQNSPGFGSVDRTTGVLATGAHTFEAYPLDEHIILDKIVLADVALSYDPTLYGIASTDGNDDKIGPDETAVSVGVTEDNPANPTAPGTPPGASTATPDIVLPPDTGQSSALIGVIAQLVFTDGSLASIQSFTVSAGNDPVAGTASAAVDTFSFAISDTLLAGTEYTAHCVGSFIDDTGALKGVDYTWTFTGVTSTGVGDTIFFFDYSTRIIGNYTPSMIDTDWSPRVTYYPNDTLAIRGDPLALGGSQQGMCMRSFFAAGEIWSGKGSGYWWNKQFANANDYNELYFAYKVFIPADMDWGGSAKMPGLGIPLYFSEGGVVPTGLNDSRWTGTIIWHRNGELAMYMYHADQFSIYGDHIWWNDFGGQAFLTKGVWNQLEVRYKTNTTPGDSSTGIVEAWLNGVKRLSYTGIMYKASGYDTTPANDNLSIGSINMLSNMGEPPASDQYVCWDDFVVSASPITH